MIGVVACSGDDPAATGADTSEGSAETSSTPDDTSGGPADDSTSATTTDGGSTPGTTSTGTSSGSPDDDTTGGSTDSSTDATADDGTTMAPAPDTYVPCFADERACDATEVCMIGTLAAAGDDQGSFCAVQGCDTEADCPDQPGGGDADTQCDDFDSDGANDCYISCEFGETCPDGMFCFGEFLCMWPETSWTCSLVAYADNICHCGCGLHDPDCANETSASCQNCGSPGSCSEGAGFVCPGDVDPDDNSICV